MPIIKGIRRINPLNLNKNVTIGVAFPLDENNMFSGTETIEDQNRANLISILLTQPGERINQPNFGVGIKNLLFENNIDLNFLKNQIQTQVSQFLGNIEITEIQTGSSDDQHTIFISITYKSLLDNEEDSIQLNFN
jgi:phage baseplate assembly protein W